MGKAEVSQSRVFGRLKKIFFHWHFFEILIQ